ncbi:hypothetical protein BC832DRAFT_595745 [Gaertneriomyces semiglobifer]|nr:hypothetical protein BC832DRAFT_595745 [Gaertneriomyces semiglobifer]
MSDTEPDAYSLDPSLLMTSRAATPRRLFSYDWARGYISPFLSSPDEVIPKVAAFLVNHTSGPANRTHTIIDLGCGNGTLLSGLGGGLREYGVDVKMIGIDLDEKLVKQAQERVEPADTWLFENLELYVGDILDPTPVDRVHPIQAAVRNSDTVLDLVGRATIVVLYLLPEAIEKLASRLMEQLTAGKMVISIRWPLKSRTHEFDGFAISQGDGFWAYQQK